MRADQSQQPPEQGRAANDIVHLHPRLAQRASSQRGVAPLRLGSKRALDPVDQDGTTTDTERVLVASITLLAYCDSRLFLAVVLIALSRKIIGGSMANHPRA